MRPVQSLIDEYAESHQNPVNIAIHWVCVPLIIFSLVGLLWSIPTPDSFHIGYPINWGTIFITLTFIYYTLLSRVLAWGMVIISSALISGIYVLDKQFAENQTLHLWTVSLIVFIIAWIGQFVGHKIEGKKPAFIKDLQFLLIGPIWLLSKIYRKLRIPIVN